MSRIEKLNILKEKLKSILSFSDIKEEKMLDALLQDGTKVRVDGETLEVGAAVFVVAEDGTEQPAPDGEHVLEDGTTIVVIEGKISEIRPIEAEKVEDKMVEGEKKQEMVDLPVVGDIETRVATLEMKVGEMLGLIQNILDDHMDLYEEQKTLQQEFSKIPGERAIENKKTPFNSEFSIDKNDELKKIRERISKIK